MNRTRIAVSVLSAGLVVGLATDPAAALPDGVSRQNVMTGLTKPIALEFLPDGRLLVAQKRLDDNQGNPVPTILIADVSSIPTAGADYLTLTDLDTASEKGLVDLCIDPHFHHMPYIYIYHSPASTGRFRITRYTHMGDHADPSSAVLIWENPEPYEGCCHFGGSLNFGPDDKLYLTVGDAFDPDSAQDLTRAGGKVIRLNRDGTIPADNPFVDGPGGNLDEIWAMGLRNPFRAAWDLETSRLLISEVGGNVQSTASEDVHLGVAGANYGWPDCEGPCENPAFADPVHSYAHDGMSAAIIGGFVYRGEQFPLEYQGGYFYADYARKWIRYATFDVTGTMVIDDQEFDGSANRLADLIEGPDGAIYTASFGGLVRRYVFDDGNTPPEVVAAEADPVYGPAPLAVSFDAVGFDADGDELDFEWEFGDGASSEGETVGYTYTANGVYSAVVRISDGDREAVSDPIMIEVGVAPEPEIIAPLDGSLFRAGDTIMLEGTAVDPDGTLGSSSYSWLVQFVHNNHLHPEFGPVGGTDASFEIGTTGHDFSDDTGYLIELTVTDADGISRTESVVVRPDKIDLTLVTDPAGIEVTLDQIPRATPFVIDTAINFDHTIEVTDGACVDGVMYEFDSWSDGAMTPTRVFTVPETDATLVAVFTAVGSCGCPADLVAPFGVLDLLDIQAFTGAFVTGDLLADMNDDGILDLVDVNAFIGGFVNGCP